MNRLIFTLLLLAGTALRADDTAAIRQLREAVRWYGKEDYAKGLDLLQQSMTNEASLTEPTRALLHYNLGVGQYRLSRPEEAARSFQAALRTTDLDLQGQTYFNLGNAQYQMARRALDEGDIVNAFQGFQAAQTNYMAALRIDSTDREAKVNLELSQLGQQKILELVAMAMMRLQQGANLVDSYQFIEAARWFQDQMPVMSKALELEPDKKKALETMAERTAGVAEILATPPEGAGP
jgi:tetratricopeptide (TPR) repeat protein